MKNLFTITRQDSPIIAVALHDGHVIIPHLLQNMKLQEHERMREEDPYTAYMANLPTTQVIVSISRFQTDLNRTKEKAIYKKPEDAWGLDVWTKELKTDDIKLLHDNYDKFYEEMEKLILATIERFGSFVVLDIHTYNHRRQDPNLEAPKTDNPEVNIGTANNSRKWKKLSDHFIQFLSHTTISGKKPDVRENVKFKGGAFSAWVNKHFYQYGCVLSIEFKKTFMDEWTGRVDIDHLLDIQDALKASLPLLKKELAGI